VKHKSLLIPFCLLAFFVISITACKKINEATELGDGLIPAVDNITTFEQYLNVTSDNLLLNDTTEVIFTDIHAIGHISADPEFGGIHADSYFDIGAPSYGIYPFGNKDSILAIDSVVLSLNCRLYYGDSNSLQTVRVFEIAQNAGFSDTGYYKYNRPDFLTTGGELGNKTFRANSFKDTLTLIRRKDTTKVAEVIRIRLNNSFGVRLTQYDTTNTANGAYRKDSIFKSLFRGLAIKADNSGNALNYIEPYDTDGSGLIVYYQVTKNGIKDTTSAVFYHQALNGIGGQANIIKRTPGGNFASYLANGIPNDDKIYLTAVPGSYASLRIPALDTFRNSVIHRAELIVTPIPSTQQSRFVFPGVLFLDRVNSTNDTAFTFDNDMDIPNRYAASGGASFSYDAAFFGGFIKTDSTYRFNISRYVQSVVTSQGGATVNNKLRLYAPVRADVFSKTVGRLSALHVGNAAGYGRIVLSGGSYADTPKRLRLRVVYSKL
jgi:hypothetical protein